MRRNASRGASSTAVDLTTTLVNWSVTGLKIAALAFVVSTAYILYGVYGGHLAGVVEPRIIGNLRLMGQVMALSAALGTICLVVITYAEVAYAVVAGLVGLGFIFGFPLMVAGQVSNEAARAGEIISSWASTTGELIVIVVGVRVLIEIVVFVRDAPQRANKMAEDEGIERPRSTTRRPWYRLSHCWEMPFCHEAIREMCPAYKKRKDCWRIKQGCNCDPYLIESLLRRGSAADISGRDETYMRSDLADQRRAGTERTRECRNCPIFNEHQREKFHLLNPILIAAAVVGLIAAYPGVRRLYVGFIHVMASLAERFAFGTQVPVRDWIQRLDSPAVWGFFYVIVGLLVMSYVLKAVEWAVLVRKVL